MKLRRDDQCASCAAPTPTGTSAFWDATARCVVCLVCHERAGTTDPARASQRSRPAAVGSANPTRPVASGTPLPPPQPIDGGVAGASARREAERRDRSNLNRPGRTWEKGADGEERLGARLDRRLPLDTVVLHDRKVPGTKGNIDHLVVAPSGVWIVDAKNWTGRVESRHGRHRGETRLFVGGRNRTKAVAGMGWQVDAVRSVLAPMGFSEAPVRPVLCFTNSEWGLFERPFEVDRVLIGWPRAIEKRITKRPALMSEALVATIATELSARLVAAETSPSAVTSD